MSALTITLFPRRIDLIYTKGIPMKFLVAAAALTVSVASLFYINSSAQELYEASLPEESQLTRTVRRLQREQCVHSYNRVDKTLNGLVPETDYDVEHAALCERSGLGVTTK